MIDFVRKFAYTFFHGISIQRILCVGNYSWTTNWLNGNVLIFSEVVKKPFIAFRFCGYFHKKKPHWFNTHRTVNVTYFQFSLHSKHTHTWSISLAYSALQKNIKILWFNLRTQIDTRIKVFFYSFRTTQNNSFWWFSNFV